MFLSEARSACSGPDRHVYPPNLKKAPNLLLDWVNGLLCCSQVHEVAAIGHVSCDDDEEHKRGRKVEDCCALGGLKEDGKCVGRARSKQATAQKTFEWMKAKPYFSENELWCKFCDLPVYPAHKEIMNEFSMSGVCDGKCYDMCCESGLVQNRDCQDCIKSQEGTM